MNHAIPRSAFIKIRDSVVVRMKTEGRAAVKDGMEAKLKASSWLQKNYPNAIVEHEREEGKLKVIIWPFGKPDFSHKETKPGPPVFDSEGTPIP